VDEQRRRSLWRAVAAASDVRGQGAWAEIVCSAAVELLSGIDSAALTIRATASAQDMLGASDEWAGILDDQQYTLGEGPGVLAFASGSPVLVSDLSVDEDRWPGFSEAARAIGAAAVFAFPLQIGGILLGTLDLYRRRVGGLTPRTLGDAAVLADLITVALLEHTERDASAGDLWSREGSYQDVNVATGILAARLHISLADAFVRLRGHAFMKNRSALEVARDVLEQRIGVDDLND
jgi:hypothetical protein